MKIATLLYQNGKWSERFAPLDSEDTLILAFCSPDIINNLLPFLELKSFYRKSKIIGCSTSGEIYGQYLYDQSIVVAVIHFDKTKIQLARADITANENSFTAGSKIVRQLEDDQLKGILVFSDGTNVNGTELVSGLNTLKNKDVVVTGGLAGDGDRFEKTWLIHEGQVVSNTVVAVGLYGPSIKVGHGSKGGWDIFGPERCITRSQNNILYELDNKPALRLYKEYLGDRTKDLPGSAMLFPLAIRKDQNDTRQLVRTILGIDEKEQSLIFAGDMPTGYLAQLMRANFDRLITGASEAGKLAAVNFGSNEPALAIAISCVGRRLVLGERTEEEIESTLHSLPANTIQIGFYSYGELSPYTGLSCDLHNQTMTITTLYEE